MATTTLKPDGDGETQWDTTGSSHYTEIDEGTGTPDNTKYVSSETFDAEDEFTFEDAADSLYIASSFLLKAQAKITHPAETAVLKFEYSTDGGSSYTLAGYAIPGAYDTEASFSLAAVTGLRLGRHAVNRFRTKVTFLEAYP